MLLLNFAHPLPEAQKDLIQQQVGQAVQRVIEAKAQFDHHRPFAAQVAELIDGVGLTSEDWQTQPILLNPPSLTAIACIVLAELHGRMGYFPPVLASSTGGRLGAAPVRSGGSHQLAGGAGSGKGEEVRLISNAE